MRLLNANKEMPKTVRDYSIFEKLREKKRNSNLLDI